MPELPEVEITRRSLVEVCGKKIKTIRFSSLAPVETTTPAKIRKALVDTVITDVERRGKYLLLRNELGNALVVHLGMSGQLRLYPRDKGSKEKHIHMGILFTDGSLLQYRDARRFGTLSLTADQEGRDNTFLARLGPDYDDPKLSEKHFIELCRRHPGISLKTLSLNQGICAGLGNIYGCEALYRARLDPRRRVRETSDQELIRFLQGARESVSLGIRNGGVSMRDYFDGKGARGVMKQYLLVYDREGKLSLDGRGRVQRIVQNARSTWFVPVVQK